MEYLIEEWNSHYNMLLKNKPYGNNNPLYNKYHKPPWHWLPEPRRFRTPTTLTELGQNSPIFSPDLPLFLPRTPTDITMMLQK